MTTDSLLFEKKEGIARLTLNRPDKLNALTADIYPEIGRVLDEMESDPALRVLVITGAGRAFCAGGDVNQLLEAAKSVEASRKRFLISHGIAARIRRLHQPVIAQINGDAVGAGFSLAMLCDLRVASESARFCASFTRIGVSADMGLIYNLVRAAGTAKAMELAFLADMIPAAEALRIGLLNAVVPADQLDARVQDWATRLARGPAEAFGLMKPEFYKALDTDFASELESEINIQTVCFGSADAREGMRAFLEKRKPLFGQGS